MMLCGTSASKWKRYAVVKLQRKLFFVHLEGGGGGWGGGHKGGG